MEFRGSVKGRKRNCYVKASHVYDFLNQEIIPEWKIMLQNISEREREIGVIQKGIGFTWTQFFKDIRKFYRLYFRHRFHRCDKRKDSNKARLISTVLNELGINTTDFDADEVFYFFYPVLDKLRKGRSKSAQEIPSTFSQVFNKYSEEGKDEFLFHPLSSQLVCFFIMNYGDYYVNKMKNSYKVKLEKIIEELKKIYCGF